MRTITLDELDTKGLQLFYALVSQVARERPDMPRGRLPILRLGQQGIDDGDSLGARSTDNEDRLASVGGHREGEWDNGVLKEILNLQGLLRSGDTCCRFLGRV